MFHMVGGGRSGSRGLTKDDDGRVKPIRYGPRQGGMVTVTVATFPLPWPVTAATESTYVLSVLMLVNVCDLDVDDFVVDQGLLPLLSNPFRPTE
ncbi:hypothetical protein SAMN06264364_10412 [Quadrisphaera granulorum]|uniref:Uncharacterized protein n=1 Tax=Quadrisphaera granulorum TaxID=317664 RepID=A0A316ABU5_9ACTN|nr:hypothetical protein BXY45_10412 [Quadrisphaera granulorum]SZE95600.1 hypothetical protein SAMN06264364_10412 [Quadrisphaera granulorum]